MTWMNLYLRAVKGQCPFQLRLIHHKLAESAVADEPLAQEKFSLFDEYDE
jgi:hypothetical protein